MATAVFCLGVTDLLVYTGPSGGLRAAFRVEGRPCCIPDERLLTCFSPFFWPTEGDVSRICGGLKQVSYLLLVVLLKEIRKGITTILELMFVLTVDCSIIKHGIFLHGYSKCFIGCQRYSDSWHFKETTGPRRHYLLGTDLGA